MSYLNNININVRFILNILLKKIKGTNQNTSCLNGEEYHAGYLFWYGLGNLLGTKECHIVW